MKIEKHMFTFSQQIAVGIRDINYGGHVGNDVYLSYCQEARLAYLKRFGFSEMDIGGCGMILVRSELEYRSELLYGDIIHVYCRTARISNTSFTMEYLIEKEDGTPAMSGNTVLVAFDYSARKVTRVPQEFRQKISEYDHGE